MFRNILLIGLGGFIGSIARFFLSKLNNHIWFFSIPVGTLLVNVLGSFLIGFLTGIAEKSPLMTVELRMLLMVGLCGGFTTFSTFSGENLMLMRNGQIMTVFLYSGLSIIFGFTAVYLGYISTKLL
ncbi:MAG: fluoride efflux transporter CrcB [Bacteroidales bacterium]|nr:fluoride efflux transporter CrcB [Bacteroidales bacterium]